MFRHTLMERALPLFTAVPRMCLTQVCDKAQVKHCYIITNKGMEIN